MIASAAHCSTSCFVSFTIVMFLSALPLKRWSSALRLTPALPPDQSPHELRPSLGGKAVSAIQSHIRTTAKAQQPQQAQHVGMKAEYMEALKRQMLQASRLNLRNDRVGQGTARPGSKALGGPQEGSGESQRVLETARTHTHTARDASQYKEGGKEQEHRASPVRE